MQTPPKTLLRKQYLHRQPSPVCRALFQSMWGAKMRCLMSMVPYPPFLPCPIPPSLCRMRSSRRILTAPTQNGPRPNFQSSVRRIHLAMKQRPCQQMSSAQSWESRFSLRLQLVWHVAAFPYSSSHLGHQSSRRHLGRLLLMWHVGRHRSRKAPKL